MLRLVEGEPSNAAKTVKYLEKVGDDSRASNAFGVVYYIAPEVLETDPVRLIGFYGVKRELKRPGNSSAWKLRRATYRLSLTLAPSI